MPSTSKFRAANARHFQVLHRSLRDPRINDADASDRILSEVDRKGKRRADDVADDLSGLSLRDNEGQAAEYGVFFDDSAYDYMQHLRPVGADREAIFVEAPKPRGSVRRALDLPVDVLPAPESAERKYADLLGIPDRPYGLQPDMDPRVREALEALEDDAYVDPKLDTEADFFDELIDGGEVEDADEWEDEDDDEIDKGQYAEVAKLKALASTRKAAALSDHDSGDDEDDGDTLAELPSTTAAGSRRKPRVDTSSRASGYSMSSSAMFRNEGLKTLDEQFDRVEAEYASSDSDEDSMPEDEDEAPEAIERADFEAIMDDFLSRHEILGGKMRPVLEGQDGLAKLQTFRAALADHDADGTLDRAEKARILRLADDMAARDRDGPQREPMERIVVDLDDDADKWDCQTILTTYSNLENHPRVLRASRGVGKPRTPQPRISIDPKTGFPLVDGRAAAGGSELDELSDHSDYDDDGPLRETIKRDRNETADERKERKKAAQAQKQARRDTKRATKAAFGAERKRQKSTEARAINVGASDVRGGALTSAGAKVIRLT